MVAQEIKKRKWWSKDQVIPAQKFSIYFWYSTVCIWGKISYTWLGAIYSTYNNQIYSYVNNILQ